MQEMGTSIALVFYKASFKQIQESIVSPNTIGVTVNVVGQNELDQNDADNNFQVISDDEEIPVIDE